MKKANGMFVYKIDSASFFGMNKWTLDETTINIKELPHIIPAILALKEAYPEETKDAVSGKEFNGEGEYWFSALPNMCLYVVGIRVWHNPYDGGYIVSPIDISTLIKETK